MIQFQNILLPETQFEVDFNIILLPISKHGHNFMSCSDWNMGQKTESTFEWQSLIYIMEYKNKTAWS